MATEYEAATMAPGLASVRSVEAAPTDPESMSGQLSRMADALTQAEDALDRLTIRIGAALRPGETSATMAQPMSSPSPRADLTDRVRNQADRLYGLIDRIDGLTNRVDL